MKRVLLLSLLVSCSAWSQVVYENDFESGVAGLCCKGPESNDCPTVSHEPGRPDNTVQIANLVRKDSRRVESQWCGDAEFGTDYWFGVRIYIPEDWTADNHFQVVLQMHTRPTVPGQKANARPPAALYIGSGKFKFTVEPPGGEKQSWLGGEVVPGTWNSVVVLMRWSTEDDGLVEAWINDQLLGSYRGPTSGEGRSGGFHFGMYSTRGPRPLVVYHDDLKIAAGPNASYEDVAPSAQDDASSALDVSVSP